MLRAANVTNTELAETVRRLLHTHTNTHTNESVWLLVLEGIKMRELDTF